jgi:acetyl-CoA C-acetyltransferase
MAEVSSLEVNAVYIVDGTRSPFLKASMFPGPFSASDLAVAAGRALLLRYGFTPADIDEVVLGCVMPSPKEANIARVVAVRLGCGDAVPAYTVQRNCASGMQAIDSAAKDIALGHADLVLAGGTEAMSRAPLLYRLAAVKFFAGLQLASRKGGMLSALLKWRPKLFSPKSALMCGLIDHTIARSMPQTAEYISYRYNISRQQMDEYACLSQQRAAAAMKEGIFKNDIIPLVAKDNSLYENDTGVRADTDLKSLAKLKPILNRNFGTITAGNSSQVSDGAAMMLLASEAAVKHFTLPVQGRIVAVQWAGVDPQQMGLGPVPAVQKLLQHYKLNVDDIDYWELNEAFAGQVLACLKALAKPNDKSKINIAGAPSGLIDLKRLNIYGGAIAVGHPIGASGARIVLQVLRGLQLFKGRYGVATICIGGGQGGAMLIENLTE